jgi:hypothetical protein
MAKLREEIASEEHSLPRLIADHRDLREKGFTRAPHPHMQRRSIDCL